MRRCVCCCGVLLVLCGQVVDPFLCGCCVVLQLCCVVLCRVAIVLQLCCCVALCCVVLCCAVLCCVAKLCWLVVCRVACPVLVFQRTISGRPIEVSMASLPPTSLVRSSPSSVSPHAVRCYTNVPTAAMFSMRHLLAALGSRETLQQLHKKKNK